MMKSECLLFVHKGCHDKVITCYTLGFCITKPVDRKVKSRIFTESAPTPIQSSSCNVHYKNEALKPLWPTDTKVLHNSLLQHVTCWDIFITYAHCILQWSVLLHTAHICTLHGCPLHSVVNCKDVHCTLMNNPMLFTAHWSALYWCTLHIIVFTLF